MGMREHRSLALEARNPHEGAIKRVANRSLNRAIRHSARAEIEAALDEIDEGYEEELREWQRQDEEIDNRTFLDDLYERYDDWREAQDEDVSVAVIGPHGWWG